MRRRSHRGLVVKLFFLKFELPMGGDGECNIDLCEELEFHGIEYIISVSVSEGPVLVIDVEQVLTTRKYRCLYSALTWFCVTLRKTMDSDGTESLAQTISRK